MAGGNVDNSQWLSVTEQTLFLADGLVRVTDLVELPYDINAGDHADGEVISFDSKSPTELSERLRTVCGTHNNTYSRLLEYRLNALRGYWNAQQQIAIEEQQERDSTTQEETIAILKKQGLWKEAEQASFSTRFSLLLVLPLLQSQSKIDPGLCGITAELLLNCLRECSPLSLTKEPSDCLNGLENLLSTWLGEGAPEQCVKDPSQRENAASALVALTCARGHLKTFIHTVHLLQKLTDIETLPVADILNRLLLMDGGQGQPSAMLGSKHIVCWGFEDLLTINDNKEQQNVIPNPNSQQTDKDKAVEVEVCRSITCDGKFIYTTNGQGRGMSKVGSGLHGTLRGYVYGKNPDLPAGRIAWGNGLLLHRPVEYDKEANSPNMAQTIDPETLKVSGKVPVPEQYTTAGAFTTVSFSSDGVNFYWFWCPGTIADKNVKGQTLNLDCCRVDRNTLVVTPQQPTLILQRKEEGSTKSLNETLLSRLRPYRSATNAASLVALGTTDPSGARKDDSSTSCGLSLKNLLKTPIYCDGSTVVILTSVPGGSSSNAARSLFGSGTSLASLRALACNLCFNVDDGQFISRTDLIDAPTCSLARGAAVAGLGVCYDVTNNSIWSCSNDWVDQYYNPGHQARHHILGRLGIQHKPISTATPEDVAVRRGIVIQQLLQHVGSMCLHQLHNDLLHTPLGSFILQQHPVDVTYLERVCDILDNAVHVDDRQTITCALIIFQLIFKMSIFKRESVVEVQLIKRTSDLVWNVLKVYQEASGMLSNIDSSSIAKEACNVLCSGLNVFYASVSERNNLLHRLLVEGEHVWGLAYLRDLVLIEFADLLDSNSTDTKTITNLRLTNDLVAYILKIAVRESCMLLRECQTTDRETFNKILSSVPMASPCLRFLMALSSHLLREAVLYRTSESDSDKDQSKEKPAETLPELQSYVLSLASKIFSGAYEVLEVLLETCNAIINSSVENMEFWLQGLERVAKATILGHLLPVLLTANTHHNLRCLQMAMADNFMPQLVQLVVLTSQAALLLKSQVQAIRQDDLMDLSTDTDIADLIGEAISLDGFELEEKEEQGFLAGLKIPAPWSTGKSIESIHPVRDNYKFKETVHIPGARCLFLRFDPRSSSQYDYDKLVIYAGPNSNCRKVAEYGGNTLGYGSRSVLGAGWPKDLIKVEGDTVTLTFEMRSGREHNTPDKAMWGFLITVRAQESTEEVSNGLPFLADLALGLSVLACTMLHLLYQGPEKTKDEEACQHLLKSKLLQRCVWQEETMNDPSLSFAPAVDLPVAIEEEHDLNLPGSPRKKVFPRIRLPCEIVHKLRELSGIPPPQMRPSIKEVIQPDILEESILSAVIKHLSLSDTVRHLTTHEQGHSHEYFLLQEVVSECYRKLYAMIRQLQTVAELEHKWQMEVADLRAGSREMHEIFFIDYHLVENKLKELTCLCFLKDIIMDCNNLDEVVSSLREKLESEVATEVNADQQKISMPKTGGVVSGLLDRLNLLLHVTIAPEGGLTRSTSHMPEKSTIPNVMARSDTDVLKSTPGYTRSISAPVDIHEALDDSIVDIMKLQRKRQAQRKGPVSILQDLVEEESKDRPPHVILIDQLFSFIGSTCNPETSVSCESFLSAARVRWRRGSTRQQALVHMKELLTAASRVGGATHLIAAVTSVLQQGPRVNELTCGGMANQVRDAFAETMTSVVQLAARYPIACCNSIGLLCIIPYTRADEKCLVRCGLVHLLDRLCSLTNYRNDSSNSEAQSMRQRVSAMAWAGFQVLSNRCVMWEQEDNTIVDDLEHSGLARQVSTLLTNHLARATECSGNEAAGNEALQEVLSLLNSLSRSRMGKAILSQPGCVSKLLSLLLDQRPSPKLVLIILQLCRVALPLMTADSCDRVELPTWGADVYVSFPPDTTESEAKTVKIASLLLAKLGDFLTPGGQTTLASRRASMEMLGSVGGATGGSDKDKDDTDVQDGRLSVFVHKRDDQSSHEVIQPLLSSDNRPFRLGGGANMERVVRMDREMTKHGKAEVTTEDAVSALRRAAKWAQMGLVVSTGSPVDVQQSDSNTSDKKKTAVEVICKDKNAELSRTDPVRPFISGHVANSMAAEVIALLHSLLTAPENLAAQTWAAAVEKVISHALSHLPLLINSVEDMSSPKCRKDELMTVAKQANAALAALGGFEPTIKPGCTVQITGPGIHNSPGLVQSVSEQTGLASIELEPPSGEDFQPMRYSDTVQVPLSRLRAPRNEPLPLHRLSMTEAIVIGLQSLLLPQGHGAGSPLAQALPVHGMDANLIANQVCRVVAEIRARACKVLAIHLKDLTFASAFIQHSSAAIDILKSLAKDCSTGERSQMIEEHCQQIRMLYRDCAKPPPPPSKTLSRPTKEITWDSARSFPPVRCCLFSHSMTGITFLGDPSAGSGLPRGTIIYATQAVPQQAPSFYWELEISSFGDSQDDSGPIISFGFMPAAERKEGAWTNPVGSCLFHKFPSNGRAVHYNGSSLLQWRSVRLDVTLDSGNIAGIGWEKQGDSPAMPGQPMKGLVYFTFNGKRLPATLEDVACGMWPVVHIQKKNTRIKANFGTRPFAYAEGRHHRNAADDYDLTQEIRETFGALPFNMGSDSDSEGPTAPSSTTSDGSREVRTPPGPPCKTATVPKSLREYNIETCTRYKRLPCYDPITTTGPDVRAAAAANAEDESEQEDAETDEPMEDHYALLVKAWEQKVFPTIRRRFRNEAERKDGLEQIRGALQLGMTDIARQTVEFLYEENGGMPRDLHLPTIEDIKEELAKFTIERVRKGTTVVVRTTSSGPMLPKFAVRGMLKTFGLTGVVLDVDQPHELVQVETYLRSEGVLVRFWYPIDMLERPPQGYRKASIIGNQVIDMSNVHIHRELLRIESILMRMYCRSSLLELISQCNSPAMEVSACSANLSSAMAASAALLQELDIENLQLLSDELLAPPQPHGCVSATSLLSSPCPWLSMASSSCAASDVFYHQPDALREELRVAIARAAAQGEDYLIELSNQICICLQTAPELFAFEEFAVNETKINTDIYFPGASFLVVSCKADPKATKKDTSLYKSPWARIYTYRGHRVKKTGQASKQEVVCYPRDTSSSSNQSDQYAPVIIPTDLVHVRIGVSPPPGVIVTIHAIPSQLPLALTYIETLVAQKYNFEHRHTDAELNKVTEVEACSISNSSSFSQSWHQLKDPGALSPWRNFDTVVIPPPVLLHVTEMVCGYLWRSDIPALIKEFLFHLLAQCLRMLHISEGGEGNMFPTLTPQYSPCLAVLQQLQAELRKLYDEETKNWASGTTVSGNGIGLGCGDSGRFSTYFHSLMEVSLAVAEVTPPASGSALGGQAGASAVGSNSGVEAGASAPGVSIPPPSSPQAGSKRKKLKAKRDRGSTTPKRSGSPRRLSESELATSPRGGAGPLSPSPCGSTTSAGSSLSNVSLSSGKPEDMLWFHRAVTMSLIMRYVTYGEKQGEQFTNDAVADAAQALSTPMAYTRLLVISGIPTNLQEEVVRKAIVRACNSEGGLFKDELFLPTQVIQIPVEPAASGGATSAKEAGGAEKKPDGGSNSNSSRAGSAEKGASASASSQGASSLTPESHKQHSPSPPAIPPRKMDGASAAVSSDAKKPAAPVSNVSPQVLSAKSIKGYAVIELRSRTKIDNVKKALFKSKTLIDGLSFDVDELSDMPEEMLSVSTVNHTLFADPVGNTALEAYLTDKIFADQKSWDLTDGVMIALTEVFHSCFISEQRAGEKSYIESGYICLSKEQIMNQVPSNLLATFFTGVRAVKKTLAEQINYIMKKYGMIKLPDKDESDRASKNGGKPVKKSSKPSKEKMALGAASTSSKVSTKDKKPKLLTTTEKSARESSSSDPASKSPKEKVEEERLLTLDGFLSYVVDKAKQDVRAVWRGLMSCGFDLHFDRCCCIDTSQAQEMSGQWTPDMDAALTLYINRLCQHLSVSPARLHPHEIYLSQAELASIDYAGLQGVPVESTRLRFALLQSLNNTLETFFLPLIDLRPSISDTLSRSSALLISKARGSILYDTKTVLLNRILNATAQRKPDQAAPEITLDPLENVGGETKSALDSNYSQAYRQMMNVPSSQLCVRLAAGGDPTYAFNVRLTGEEVHGTSGSFRHFLWQVARELEGPVLDLFMPCPSSTSHKNRGKYVLKPGPMTYPVEKFLEFLGQLLGITMRADIPLGLDLLPVFWKNLVGLPLDPITDLQEADIVTYNYIKKFEMAESEAELQILVADSAPHFVHSDLNGDEVELIPNGRHVTVNWENRQQYVDSIRALRMSELTCHERMTALRAGMASVIPIQMLPVMSSLDADVRICGLPEIDLDFLMAHTMYQVGLMESDVHIQYFWTALESFTQEELHKFIKFACNQERIPQTCPCRDGGSDTAHVPPYPMKIAPPDGTGTPDARFVRAETCMFMIKLPQYSSQQIMTERLLYAIHCREDPLSG